MLARLLEEKIIQDTLRAEPIVESPKEAREGDGSRRAQRPRGVDVECSRPNARGNAREKLRSLESAKPLELPGGSACPGQAKKQVRDRGLSREIGGRGGGMR